MSGTRALNEEVKTNEVDGGRTEIRYRYKVIVETEFTIYPDNPPMEILKESKIVIDEKYGI